MITDRNTAFVRWMGTALPDTVKSRIKTLAEPLTTPLGRIKEHLTFSSPPILIGGCGRSGTTLLLSILGAHPHIFAVESELSVFATWTRDQNGRRRPSEDVLYRHLLMSRVPRPATRWCEKTPSNVRHFREILDFFGQNVRLIHIVRDGRDVMLSRHPQDPHAYWVDPDRWVADVRAGLAFRDHDQVFTIRYEDLVIRHKETLLGLCAFLDEDPAPEMYDFVHNTNITDSLAWSGPARDIHANSIGKWKRTKDQQRVQQILAHPGVVPLLAELGYETQ